MRVLPTLLLSALLAPLVLSAQASGPGVVAVPLAAPPPSWYTDDAHARVMEAAKLGLAYDVETGMMVAVPSGDFIRPGARIVAPNGCTAGFVFGAAGAYKVSTAGHCAALGQEIVLQLASPAGLVLVGVGTVSASSLGLGSDWALADVHAHWQTFVDPCAALILGPNNAYGGGAPAELKWVSDDGARPRAGVLTGFFAGGFYAGGGPAIFGDSGAPVMTIATRPLGEAVGLLTHIIIDATAPAGTTIAGTSVGAIPAALVRC